MTNHPGKGRSHVKWPFNFRGTSNISGTAEPRVVKLCILVGYVKS